jgi:hypothetical protein
MTVPSIKGTAWATVAEDLHRMLEDGRLSRDELEARMSAEELKLFEAKPLATRWYPVSAYRVLLALIAEKEAKGKVEEYLTERGWRAAERLKEAGVYRQLDSDNGSDRSWSQRVAGLISAISKLMYNFGSWTLEPPTDDSTFRVTLGDAKAFADECRYTAAGFLGFAATMIAGAPVKVTSQRPAPDRVVYTIRRS